MKLVKKCIVLIMLLNIICTTCAYAVNTNNLIDNTSSNTTSDQVIPNPDSNNDNTNELIPNPGNNNDNTDEVLPNPDNNHVPPKKDEVQDYFAELAIEGESVTEFMSKIDGSKLLEAICNQQTALGNTWMEDNRVEDNT